MKTVRLENWSAKREGSPYSAPEVLNLVLDGVVYGHPKKNDGTRVITSPVEAAVCHMVKTASGTVYELGDPDPGYVAYLKEKGIPFDPAAPIRVAREEVTQAGGH